MTNTADLVPMEPDVRLYTDEPLPRSDPESGGPGPWGRWKRAASVGLTVAAFLVGTILIAAAYTEARTSIGSEHFDTFWVGVSLILIATLVLGTRPWLTTRGVKLLLVCYGAVTFIPKFIMSTTGPVYYDEFGHLRHAYDLLHNGNPFNADPYLSIAKFFPGLSVVTVLVHDVTGLSMWHSGQAIVLAAHCSVLVTVFLIGRAAGLSQRACVAAAVVYSLNPSFLYFDTQYSYESLALPLALFVILACIRTAQATSGASANRWRRAGISGAILCIVTHHLSSLFMGAVCLALLIGLRMDGSRDEQVQKVARRDSWWVAIVASCGSLAWIGIAAPETYSYVGPHVASGFTGLVQILLPPTHTVTGSGAGAPSSAHTLFAGSPNPLYEQVAAFMSPVLMMVPCIFAAVHLWNIRHGSLYSHSRARSAAEAADLGPMQQRIVLVSVGLAALYFASLPIALTSGGGESAHRSWGYTYLGVALVIGYFFEFVVARRVQRSRLRRMSSILLLVTAVVVLIGNVSAGESVFYRFPGPYVFGTDTRSTTPEVHHLTEWMNRNLVPGSLVVTDRFTGEFVEAYTELNVPSVKQYPAYAIYREGDHPSPALRAALKSDGFRYFVLDTRIGGGPPFSALFEGYEGSSSVDPAALSAMQSTPFARLIHQTQNYKVFALYP